jgi:hypothetical protein
VSLDSATARGRSAAERLLTDTFTAYAPDPTATSTDADGFEIPGFTNQGSTPGKIQGSKDTTTEYVTVGEVRRPVLKSGLHIPIGAPVPAAGDAGQGWEYVCTAVGALSDLALLGRRYRVVNVPAKSFATARRLDVVIVD